MAAGWAKSIAVVVRRRVWSLGCVEEYCFEDRKARLVLFACSRDAWSCERVRRDVNSRLAKLLEAVSSSFAFLSLQPRGDCCALPCFQFSGSVGLLFVDSSKFRFSSFAVRHGSGFA